MPKKVGCRLDQFASGNTRRRSTLTWSATRHFSFLVRRLTLRRIWNCGECVTEMLLKRSVLHSHPFYLRVAVSDCCNLRCPGCLIAQEPGGALVRRPVMPLDLFIKCVSPFLPNLLAVNLYDQGEPLLNADLPRMISFLRDHNVSACVSSNFSLPLGDDKLEALLRSGLDHLIIAVDGATQETYALYRKGGSLALVLSNIRRLLALRKRIGTTSPLVDFQFIEFEHNAHEKNKALLLAQQLGSDRFTVIQGSCVQGWRGMKFCGNEQARRRAGCYQAWVAAHIDSEGGLKPCDYGNDHGMPSMGKAWDYESLALRNHHLAVLLRRAFCVETLHLNQCCRTCSLYRVAPSGC